MSLSDHMRRITSCIDHRGEASAQAQWCTRAQAGRAQPGDGALSFRSPACAGGQKRAYRRGGGVLVGVQPPLQRLVGGLQPDLVHVKGGRPAGMRRTTPVGCSTKGTAPLKALIAWTSDLEQSCFPVHVIGQHTHRSRSRKRSAVGTAGWMTLHWLQKKKDTRGTCDRQPCTSRIAPAPEFCPILGERGLLQPVCPTDNVVIAMLLTVAPQRQHSRASDSTTDAGLLPTS